MSANTAGVNGTMIATGAKKWSALIDFFTSRDALLNTWVRNAGVVRPYGRLVMTRSASTAVNRGIGDIGWCRVMRTSSTGMSGRRGMRVMMGLVARQNVLGLVDEVRHDGREFGSKKR